MLKTLKKKVIVILIAIVCVATAMLPMLNSVAFAEGDSSDSSAGSVTPITVKFYAMVNGAWAQIDTQTISNFDSDSNNTYYLTIENLQSAYKNFEIDWDSYNGERIFGHTNNSNVYFDRAPYQIDGEWHIPITRSGNASVYYAPNNIEGSTSSYITSYTSLSNEIFVKEDNHYSIMVSDGSNIDPDQAGTYYCRTNGPFTITLNDPTGSSWKCLSTKTLEEITPDEQSYSDNKITYTFNNVTVPLKITSSTAVADQYVIKYEAASLSSSLKKVGSIEVKNQEITEDGEIYGNASFSDVWKKLEVDSYLTKSPDKDNLLVNFKNTSSKDIKGYYVFKGWRIGVSDVIIGANETLSTVDILNNEVNGVVTLTAVWDIADSQGGSRAVNFFLNKTCEISDNTGSGYQPHSVEILQALFLLHTFLARIV